MINIGHPEADPAELKKMLDGASAVVVATRFESFSLWKENEDDGADKRPWKSHGMGIMHTVGVVGDMPVCIAITFATISGSKVVFIEPTSQVVDHRMIDKWLEETMPVTAFEDNDPRKRLNTTDPTNFCNILPRKLADAA